MEQTFYNAIFFIVSHSIPMKLYVNSFNDRTRTEVKFMAECAVCVMICVKHLTAYHISLRKEMKKTQKHSSL